ncbi:MULTISPECIES: putative toxin-antitoxin system toxin component, PIN family [unclassified Coleofasciculus]|uniref:putative toxin-antitoxin system toxin component, PIN family n=1 Tax=unclassified Coleofasciculus TaxID=2692782 RepID=UPI00187ED39C|nr:MULTISPECIES: putative toxin-antitoxin system toxin component, PIN family [unclassified Coleofasciculus]MBE9128365.1 putative toxin-antitoxin system toxin component, PIN family [Coleofasciculus sp. LEGE 07081]MBE9151421.1 putative toxin-antitoxin system toxin component, PIN family [Coleofasciculus sp. LEGE 07092]
MRVLIDTNVILDYLLEREPFLQDAELLFQAIGSEQVIGYVTATTLTDIFYIARKQTQSIEQARQVISITLAVMEICPVNRAVLEVALTSGIRDFEDAVQVACAMAQNLDAIITRDTEDFSNATVPVLSVSQLLEQLE